MFWPPLLVFYVTIGLFSRIRKVTRPGSFGKTSIVWITHWIWVQRLPILPIHLKNPQYCSVIKNFDTFSIIMELGLIYCILCLRYTYILFVSSRSWLLENKTKKKDSTEAISFDKPVLSGGTFTLHYSKWCCMLSCHGRVVHIS